MGQSKPPGDKMNAAAAFMQRAQDAISAADHARSEDAVAAYYKEAEAWIYMASQVLDPGRAQRPEPLERPRRRPSGERRSFGRDE